MRKAMWKKGLSVAMAAAMLTGTVTVPAVFNSSAIVKAETKDQNEESYYILMNIPYAQFYKNELNNNNIDVDAFTSATKAKTRTGSLVEGSYHVNSDGSDITGITYPVKVSKTTDLTKFTEITDDDSLEITTSNRGQTSTTTYKGEKALFESASYSYYKLKEAPSYYKELTVNEDGSFSFGKTTAVEKEVKGVTAKLKTETSYGDYQLDLDFAGVDSDAEKIDRNTKVYAAVITTTDGTQYGLRHMENIWLGTELAWSTGFTKAVHNCPTSSKHYESMMGKTINAVTYYTDNGVFKYSLSDIYVPKKFDSSDYSVKDADVTSGKTAVTIPASLPEDYDVEYKVDGLKEVKIENNVLTYDASQAITGIYTLTITDKKGVYAPISTEFELYTTKIPATFNNNVSTPALVKASDATDLDFTNFISNIETVSVNGKSYTQTGRGSVQLINEDGTLIKDAAPFKEEGSYKIVVKSLGYQALEFTYNNKKEEAPATTETKPAATTTATKPTATKPTTAAKPATKKVTVKKQTAKVKAGKKKLTVTWKKDKNVSGYQIKIATKKNFKGAKTYTVKSYKTYKKVIKKLKANKKYFVKVRAYKTVGKSKVYGAYSAVKSCKVK